MNKVVYVVNGEVQTFWNRMKNSKTFYLANAAFMGSLADAVDKALTTGVYLIAWKQVLATAVLSAAAVALKDAMKKKELAELANNEAVPNHEAKEVIK